MDQLKAPSLQTTSLETISTAICNLAATKRDFCSGHLVETIYETVHGFLEVYTRLLRIFRPVRFSIIEQYNSIIGNPTRLGMVVVHMGQTEYPANPRRLS